MPKRKRLIVFVFIFVFYVSLSLSVSLSVCLSLFLTLSLSPSLSLSLSLSHPPLLSPFPLSLLYNLISGNVGKLQRETFSSTLKDAMPGITDEFLAAMIKAADLELEEPDAPLVDYKSLFTEVGVSIH